MPGLPSSHRERMIEVLRHFHSLGYTLMQCCERKRMNRKPRTLLEYARYGNLVFPDSIDVAMALRERAKKRSEAA
jgi:hypothetical protein